MMQTTTRLITGIILLMLVVAALLIPQEIYANDEVSWVGRIETRPTGGFIGTWIVRGHAFTVTDTTQIKEELGPLSVGVCAEVKYVSAGSSDTANNIERQ